jgi:DNA-binding PadR family transcriptional regulator
MMFRDKRNRRERFFGSRPRESSFQKGDLKYVILDLLKDKPRHGYEIIRELEEASHGLYKPSPGAVYPTLQMLEDLEYAVCTSQDGKKVYSITESGKSFLEERKDQTNGVKNQMKNRWGFRNIGRMAMIMKEYHALENLIGSAIRQLDEEKAKEIRSVLTRAYDEIEDIIQ